jgi:hypothetical protein
MMAWWHDYEAEKDASTLRDYDEPREPADMGDEEGDAKMREIMDAQEAEARGIDALLEWQRFKYRPPAK